MVFLSLIFHHFLILLLKMQVSNKKKHDNFGIFFFYLGCCEHCHTVGLSNKFFTKLSPFTAACCYLCSVHLVMSPSLVLCLYLLYNTHDVHVVFSQLKPSSLFSISNFRKLQSIKFCYMSKITKCEAKVKSIRNILSSFRSGVFVVFVREGRPLRMLTNVWFKKKLRDCGVSIF